MVTTADRTNDLNTPVTENRGSAGSRLFQELQHPREIVSNLTPNWYASIMGTGIVATAAASLPLQFPGLRLFATIVWAGAAILLVALTVATVLHWVHFRSTARSHHSNPVMAHFYGAPPMALLTVGAGTILLGTDVLGEPLAVRIDWVLWTAGTVFGLISAVAVPYLAFTRHAAQSDSAFGGWLMPVVPPMVSASTGALLLAHLASGQARETMLWACYGMFGLSLFASIIIITLIWSRLAQHKLGQPRMVPTLWIVLGPLGQSVTAANLLGGNAHLAVDEALAQSLLTFGIIYGVITAGFVLMWTALASAITIRTARAGLPFSLTWWSFTFPIGTCATGFSGLAHHTGLAAFQILAVVYYAALVGAWMIVAVRTFHASVLRGTLFAPPNPTA